MRNIGHLTERPLFLLGMPRSSTTWLSQIFESSPDFIVRLSPNYSWPLKNQIDMASSREDWAAQLGAAITTDDPFMTHNYRRETGELGVFPPWSVDTVTRLAVKDTRFHDLYQRAMALFEGAQIIYIVRHPASVFG